MPQNISLLGSTSRIETPYIKVTFGSLANGYTFGVYRKVNNTDKTLDGFYSSVKEIYPNYIQSLQITKINGQVNTYILNLDYPVTQDDDPNFFEKIFSSVSKTRKIIFSYGDMSLPTFVYKNEEAIITNIQTRFNIEKSVISYIVSAVSSASLLSSGSYTFINPTNVKPSDEIKRILWANNDYYGLQQIFYGMNNKRLVLEKGLIPGDDQAVKLDSKENVSVLDYLTYLVSCMVPSNSTNKAVKQRDIYVLTIIDDTTGEYGGPYFKIVKNTSKIENSGAYEIDIGYSTANIVTDFNVDNQENYSILYDWQSQLNPADFTQRINDKGEWEKSFAPIISSKNNQHRTRISDQVWWTKITEYPISATITIKGLLRPAILMTHVRLNVYFFGRKHISSGLYIVTKQIDKVDANGYKTTLSLTRISGDTEK